MSDGTGWTIVVVSALIAGVSCTSITLNTRLEVAKIEASTKCSK